MKPEPATEESPISVPEPRLPEAPVTVVRCRVFRALADEHIALSFSSLTHRVMVLVEVELADGSAGVGESWANHPSWAWQERVATVREGIAPQLVGKRLATPGAVQRELLRHLVPIGRQWGAQPECTVEL